MAADWRQAGVVDGRPSPYPARIRERPLSFKTLREKHLLSQEKLSEISGLGLRTVQLPLNGVVHDAQRKSQRDPKYRRWHLMSMLRFFCSAVFLRLQWQRLAGMRSKQIANAGP